MKTYIKTLIKTSFYIIFLSAGADQAMAVAGSTKDFAYIGDPNGVLIYHWKGPESGGGAFDGSSMTLTVPGEVDGYPVKKVGGGFLGGCYSRVAKIIISAPVESISYFTPTDVTENFFLLVVQLPSTVTSIAENTFRDHVYLNTINFPVGAVIGDHAFDGCIRLKNISPVPKEIGIRAFRGCSSLQAITINSASIPEGAFMDCSDFGRSHSPLGFEIDR
jgi:hypothetical protein